MGRLQHAPLFRGRHYPDDVIILAIRWYLRYSLSYRELEESLAERGVQVDHMTLWRWIQRDAPELERRVHRSTKPTGSRWHIDETDIRVAGQWTYSYRAVDSAGNTVDFFLSEKRDEVSAKLFFRKALAEAGRPTPQLVVGDGNPTYPIAVRAMQREGRLPEACQCCSCGDNNRIEQDHRAIQRRADAKQHFRSLAGARNTTRATRRCTGCANDRCPDVKGGCGWASDMGAVCPETGRLSARRSAEQRPHSGSPTRLQHYP